MKSAGSHRRWLIWSAVSCAILMGLWLFSTRLGQRTEKLTVPEIDPKVSTEKKARIQEFWKTFRAGEFAHRAGQVEKAIQLYLKALKLNPGHENARYGLGNLYFDSGQYELAKVSFQQMLAINPLSVRSYYQLGRLYSSVRPGAPLDFATARKHFEKALALNSGESGPFLRLARLHAQMGDWKKVRSEAQTALKRNPRSFEASHLLGAADLHDRNLSAAAKHFSKAITQLRGDQPIAGILGEGDTASTSKTFDARDARVVRDLFALHRIVGIKDDLRGMVPKWVLPSQLSKPLPMGSHVSKSLSGAKGRGVWIDVNRDTFPDLVVATNPLTVFRSLPKGELGKAEPLLSEKGKPIPGAAFDLLAGDLNGDGKDDLFVVGAGWAGRASDRVLLAEPDTGFRDVTDHWGLREESTTAAALLADVNGDRRLDLVRGLNRSLKGQALEIWWNEEGRFRKAPAQSIPNIPHPVIGISSADTDRNGSEEIYLSLWKARGRLLSHQKGGRVVDRTAGSGLRDAPIGIATAFFDFDRDGDADLLVGSYPGNELSLRASLGVAVSKDISPSRFYRQIQPGKFQEAKGMIPKLYAGAIRMTSGDFNGDGWQDLYLACGGYEFDHWEEDILLINRAGKSFQQRSLISLFPEVGKSTGIAGADINRDGLWDLYIARSGILPGDQALGKIIMSRKGSRG